MVYYTLMSAQEKEKIQSVAIFPTRNLCADPLQIRDYAQAVEELGFDYILAYDHVVLGDHSDGNNGYRHTDQFHEPILLFSHLSAYTRRVKMITGVLVSPQRQTALLAKQTAYLDRLSRGRFELGIGIGTNVTEFAAMGVSMEGRGRRMEEQMDLLRQYWSQDLVIYDGEYEKANKVGINPRPANPIPIWIGGWSDTALERTARKADGWLPLEHPSRIKPILDSFREQLTVYRRNPDTFPIMGGFGSHSRGTDTGDNPDEWEGVIREWRSLGVRHIAFGTSGRGCVTVDDHIKNLTIFRDMING